MSTRHRLSEIDEETLTATCLACGPTRVRRRNDRANGWRCCGYDRVRRQRVRRRYRAHLKPSCERCGFVAEDPVQLDIHHRDGDHTNDDPANLETVCANCHRLIHLPEMLKGASPTDTPFGTNNRTNRGGEYA